jgi:serine acetyltransferase
VTVYISGCDIKPETEFEKFKTSIKHSDNFVVTNEDTFKSGENVFVYKTVTLNETISR